jgi:ribose 5-phosphate isomerase B
MKIYIGADHRGFQLKEKVAKWLFEWGYEYLDIGASSLDPNDDYTKYASEVASLVSNNKNSKGVLLCGSGVGVEVAANKFDGVRASVGKSPEQVKAGRNDDDMNVLVLAAEFTKENEAKEMVKVFLETKFAGTSRFKKRLRDIEKIEANN